ncbi:hypothetical protein [Streptomyces sp. B21-083]|uniref:hypothetical protein n=1 Tax=Streptomyces sp. B21-083 TaxID=3039410 RepID=UPI002FEEC82D
MSAIGAGGRVVCRTTRPPKLSGLEREVLVAIRRGWTNTEAVITAYDAGLVRARSWPVHHRGDDLDAGLGASG